jgi:pyruvate kinase
VVAKVERVEAVDALAEVAARVNALWECRGDIESSWAPAPS